VGSLLELLEDVAGELPPDLIRGAVHHSEGELWWPNEGPQCEAFDSLADELLYGGEAGGGKTDLLLGLAITAHSRSLILRRVNKEVDGLAVRAEEIIGSRQGYNSSKNIWRLGASRIIMFGGCEHLNDRRKYQGIPKDLVAFDELANFLEEQYTFIIAWARSTVKGQRVRVVAASNPPVTPEGMWIVKRWAPWLDPNHPNPALAGELRWFTTIDGEDTEVDGPGAVVIDGKPYLDKRGKPIYPKSRSYIPASLGDNPDLAKTDYGATLAGLPGPLRAALMEGDFSRGLADDDWQVIPTAWIDAAIARWQPQCNLDMQVMGVDIAQGGDDSTVIARRHGQWFDKLLTWKGVETRDGPAVASLVLMYRRKSCEVALDCGGGWGQSAYDHLSQDFQPKKFVGSMEGPGRSREGLKFRNLRAAAWWRMREVLDPHYGSMVALPPDNELRADLASCKWQATTSGILIEDKKDIKKRLGRSPDRGDAVVIANWFSGPLDDPRIASSSLTRGLSNRANVGARRHFR
jgi:hypothetical protein